MELSINEKKDNGLLSRTEICGTLTFQNATPSNIDVAKNLATKLAADEKLVVIKKIKTKFGAKSADLCAYVYKDAATLKRIEPKVGKKAAEKAAKKAGSHPAPAAASV